MPALILALVAFVLVVLKALGPLAALPLWLCLLPLAPLALALIFVFLAAILVLVAAVVQAVKQSTAK